MMVKVIKRSTRDFEWIVGHTFRVNSETEDGKGYYINLSVGCCRVEKEDVEVM